MAITSEWPACIGPASPYSSKWRCHAPGFRSSFRMTMSSGPGWMAPTISASCRMTRYRPIAQACSRLSAATSWISSMCSRTIWTSWAIRSIGCPWPRRSWQARPDAWASGHMPVMGIPCIRAPGELSLRQRQNRKRAEGWLKRRVDGQRSGHRTVSAPLFWKGAATVFREKASGQGR